MYKNIAMFPNSWLGGGGIPGTGIVYMLTGAVHGSDRIKSKEGVTRSYT